VQDVAIPFVIYTDFGLEGSLSMSMLIFASMLARNPAGVER
jgi:hypothetical protein